MGKFITGLILGIVISHLLSAKSTNEVQDTQHLKVDDIIDTSNNIPL